ncbi:MAG: glycoside hydrolase family 2 protein [Anaerolineae bacterium]
MQLNLTQLKWTLIGWLPNCWAWLGNKQDVDLRRYQCTPEIQAVVPGAVQEDLLRAGLIQDWNVGLNSLQCEWVEHRHWEYRCQVKLPEGWTGQEVRLHAEGLDYAGFVLVDGRQVGEFIGSHIPHEFDLTKALQGGEHRLSFIFTEAPHEQGQIGYTSRSHYFKSRFNYGWDWCVRLVPLGIWDNLWLMTVGEVRLNACLPMADYKPEQGTGTLNFRISVSSALAQPLHCRVTVKDDTTTLCARTLSCAFGAGTSETVLHLPDDLPVEPWWPNGMGPAKLYQVILELEDLSGNVLDSWNGRVGFRQIRWLPCEGAPANAEPWLCEINCRKLFLQGANWVPIRMTYGSVTPSMYAKLLNTYQELGFNLLRVWGGGILEKQAFYDCCDELGLLVWQEYPLSSSGIENEPPHAPDAVAALAEIARSYNWRRGGHASLLCWCGGNELFYEKDLTRARPVDAGAPCIALLAGISAELTPFTRFLAASPSGPMMWLDPAMIGQGLHHDVHGPWEVPNSLDKWKDYWNKHDALFISEVGVPSCSSAKMLRDYAGEMDPWPPTADNPYWLYRAPWWIEWEQLAAAYHFSLEVPELERYVEASQELQSEALVYLVQSCKQRFPRCGGVMLWHGHDLYPCPSNNSVIDFDGVPKPAAIALSKVLKNQ